MQREHASAALHRNDSDRDGERVGDRLIAVFCLALVMLNPLVVGLFDHGPAVRLMGMPLLFVFLFGTWGLLIALLAWAVERTSLTVERTTANGVGADERRSPNGDAADGRDAGGRS